jgi:hypothetical protein
MFSSLIDSLSLLFSWRWPKAAGEITAVDIDTAYNRGAYRLAVAYKFFVNNDGPYTGESYWEGGFSADRVSALLEAQKKLHIGQRVTVRYRPDDPSINRLDRSTWREL